MSFSHRALHRLHTRWVSIAGANLYAMEVGNILFHYCTVRKLDCFFEQTHAGYMLISCVSVWKHLIHQWLITGDLFWPLNLTSEGSVTERNCPLPHAMKWSGRRLHAGLKVKLLIPLSLCSSLTKISHHTWKSTCCFVNYIHIHRSHCSPTAYSHCCVELV